METGNKINPQEFWQNWSEFRLSDPESTLNPHFYDLIKALPFAQEVKKWAKSIPQQSHYISLASGSLTPERLFAKTLLEKSSSITAINDPDLSHHAINGLSNDGIKTPLKYLHHDLNTGLPKSINLPKDNYPLHGMSIWGITYLEDKPLKQIINQFKKLGENRKTTLDLIMLTGEKFDPKTLALKYFTSALPQAFLSLKPKEIENWVKGLKAVPNAVEFGNQLKKVDGIKIRTAQETISLIQSWNLSIEKTQEMLWGQTTAIRLSLNQ